MIKGNKESIAPVAQGEDIQPINIIQCKGKGKTQMRLLKWGKYGGCGRGGGRLVVWEKRNYTYVRSTSKCITPPFILHEIFFLYIYIYKYTCVLNVYIIFR